ncbi:MAG: hypothetical protein WA101_00050 [Minisyncoccia bacterium]
MKTTIKHTYFLNEEEALIVLKHLLREVVFENQKLISNLKENWCDKEKEGTFSLKIMEKIKITGSIKFDRLNVEIICKTTFSLIFFILLKYELKKIILKKLREMLPCNTNIRYQFKIA